MYSSLQQMDEGPPLGPNQFSSPSPPPLIDPALLRAARHIYRTYYEVHPEETHRPLGIAIARTTHRGKLIFNERPILLPQECFIPLNQLEPGLH